MTPDRPSVAKFETTCVVHVLGELDLNTVPDLEQQGMAAVTDSAVLTLTLNLSGVTFIDSTGIGTLVRLRLAADERHKQLVLSRPSEPVRRVLAITALTAAFTIDDTPTTSKPDK